MRIGVTQRVDVEVSYGERRDCLDQAWTRLFSQLGWDVLPIPNHHSDIVGWAQRQALDGLVLSGGNDLSHLPDAVNAVPERDACERELLSWAERMQIPVLGVCRGMQMMNVYLGGLLVPVTEHVACHHPVRLAPGQTGWPAELNAYVEVNSFHAWGIMPDGLAEVLQPRLVELDSSIEAFCHRSLPWVGIMWHPERDNRQSATLDLALLKAVFRAPNQDEQ